MSHLQSPFKSQPALSSPKLPYQIPHFRVYRRRRLKPLSSRHFPIRCQFRGFEDILSSQLAHDVFTSLIGFASASAAALSISSFRRNSPPSDAEEWILFSSPTPFNRFVLLRCPSVAFEGSELLEDVNDRLVKEERHFVRINSGRIQVQMTGSSDSRDSDYEPRLLKYQRMCLTTDDGGVISLDWPENLDLKEERGLDTTLLLVPGTAQGSLDADVKAFVCEAICRGFFPVVMNPRGCAGSPLTTARLFTAADSDDIHRATQFISKVRPWTTLMGVGWGFGANMLTKYLAEAGERTPITAATCINNPFDLEEATRSYPHSIAIDERLTAGLKDILLANKELFQGRAKGFDVEKALSAKTVRNFEKAISMVANGFEEIAEFYSKSSTRNLIGDLKVPVLFIQSDDGTVPMFSIPRGEIGENPYTSLLLRSSLPSGGAGKPALSWCQHVTVEWLAAVELGLLKGRHPLLEDIDISISPSAGLSLVESRLLDKSSKEDKLEEFTNDNILEDGHGVTSDTSGSLQDPQSGEGKDKGIQVVDNDVLQQSSSGDMLTEKRIEENSTDDDDDGDDGDGDDDDDDDDVDDEGQVAQSAEVVMNMLDKTLPGVLTDEKKEKVLAAMNRGETLMKALEDAVPEDVRGKLTTSVSDILAAQGAKLRFNKIKPIDVIPSNSKNEEHGSVDSEEHSGENPDMMQKVENSGSDGSKDNQEVKDSHDHALETASESEHQMPEDSSEDRSGSGDSEEHSGENPSNPNRSENESEPGEAAAVEGGADHNSNADESVTEDLTEEKKVESPIAEVEPPSESSESQTTETDTDDDQKNENKDEKPVLDQKTTSSTPGSDRPSFSVTQALDAFSGIDDSTQVAVNSVFGVLEEMITRLEEDSDNQKENEVDGKQIDSPLQKHDISQDTNASVNHDKTLDSRSEIGHGPELEEPNQSFADVDGSSGKKYLVKRIGKEKNDMKTKLVNSKHLDSFPYKVGHANSIPFYATPKPYEEFVRGEYVRRYLLSKVPPKSLDMDKTAALFLDYIPEEGQWKLLEEPGQDGESTEANQFRLSAEEKQIENIIDPPYKHSSDKELEKMGAADHGDSRAVELKHFIKKITYDCLRIEVDRRIHLEDRKGIEPSLIKDFDLIGNAVCSTITHDKDMTLAWKTRKNGLDYSHLKLGTLAGGKIVSAVSLAIQETDHLKKVLPVGLVVGSCLAALREYFVITEQDSARTETDNEAAKNMENVNGKPSKVKPLMVKYSRDTDVTKENAHQQQHNEKSDNVPDGSLHHYGKEKQMDDARNNTVMAGVVTAALGTTAFLVQQQGSEEGDGDVSLSNSLEQGGDAIHNDLLEASSQKDQTNLVTSLAERAMSLAAPVVPTREDGGVDQAKIVAMLAELGQRGGMLRLVGKVALLWGGLRGAMSLTDKLLSFLHIAERPLVLRIIGFMLMVLLLWSPIVIPLLPTLVQGWMMNDNSPKMAELACIAGFYAAVMILLTIWGKRIRKYEKPFQQYGLDFTSIEKVQDLFKGLVWGIVLVSAIQYMNVTLGYMTFSLPPNLLTASPSSSSMTKLKVYGSMLLMAGQGIVTAGAIAIVEELLFRSWLPSEIAADLGYHWGIFLSGLLFALTQRPLWAVPGLLLWSTTLSGLRRINGGSLSIPIGLRTGIIASSHILQTGGFLTYQSDFPQWITGTQPFQPFSGVVGMAFSLLLAAILYPRDVKPKILNSSRPIRVDELSRPIREQE